MRPPLLRGTKVHDYKQFVDMNLSEYDLTNCYFSDCKFINCQFIGADLTGAEFSECKFVRCTFQNCAVVGMKWVGSITDHFTRQQCIDFPWEAVPDMYG